MRFNLATAAALLAVAQARITGISVPDTIKPGSDFDVIIESSDYVQRIYDGSITFGFASDEGYPDSLGTPIKTILLGADASNRASSFWKVLRVPEDAASGDAVISASLISFEGAAASPIVSNYNVTVTFGDETSEKYVTSAE